MKLSNFKKAYAAFACAKHLHEQFPDAEIQAFALIRTQGLIPEIDILVDSSTGRIAYNAMFDEGDWEVLILQVSL